MAEIDIHWREFVRSLEGLSARMHGPQDLEQVLLGIHTVLHDAVGQAQKNGPRLSAQVRSSLRRESSCLGLGDTVLGPGCKSEMLYSLYVLLLFTLSVSAGEVFKKSFFILNYTSVPAVGSMSDRYVV